MSLASAPKQIGAAADWTSASSFGEDGCALGPAGEASCWGNNESGQLGLGDTASRASPAATGAAFDRIVFGRQHACGIAKGGASILCSGRNANGQLGTANSTPSASFVALATAGKPYAGLAWKQIAAGEEHTCAVATDGGLWCWGLNTSGQLGQAAAPPVGTLVQVLPAMSKTWTQVTAGQLHACATRADQTLWCWGRNLEGQLGDGAPIDTKIPPFSVGGGYADLLAGGVNHTCAVKTDGTLWCWGRNANGQLGDNTLTDRATPGQVGADADWVEVTAGNATTCARKADGTLWCWGANSLGQLGVGDLGQRKLPAQAIGGAVWAEVRAGYAHACGRRTDGTLWCWGSGEYGQQGLGDGFAAAPTPLAAEQ
jgi:alpha-tubulin suppressor-like RCC1 family protein